MNKILLKIIFFITVFSYLFAYKLTVQEKLIGILNKTTVIENIEYIEIIDNYVHVEIKEHGDIYPYSFPCNTVIAISESNDKTIPFSCNGKGGVQVRKFGSSSLKKGSEDFHNILDPKLQHNPIKEAMDNMGRSYNYQDQNRKIKIEDNVVMIELEARRTNIKSSLIKTYWLCGHVMYKNNLFYPEIRVILSVQNKKKERLITSSNGKNVINFGKKVSPSRSLQIEFLKNIDVYR